MPTDLANLQTAKSQAISNLVAITSSPSPSYSIDGQSVSKAEYIRTLQEQIAALNELIAIEGGPFEYQTQAVT